MKNYAAFWIILSALSGSVFAQSADEYDDLYVSAKDRLSLQQSIKYKPSWESQQTPSLREDPMQGKFANPEYRDASQKLSSSPVYFRKNLEQPTYSFSSIYGTSAALSLFDNFNMGHRNFWYDPFYDSYSWNTWNSFNRFCPTNSFWGNSWNTWNNFYGYNNFWNQPSNVNMFWGSSWNSSWNRWGNNNRVIIVDNRPSRGVYRGARGSRSDQNVIINSNGRYTQGGRTESPNSRTSSYGNNTGRSQESTINSENTRSSGRSSSWSNTDNSRSTDRTRSTDSWGGSRRETNSSWGNTDNSRSTDRTRSTDSWGGSRRETNSSWGGSGSSGSGGSSGGRSSGSSGGGRGGRGD